MIRQPQKTSLVSQTAAILTEEIQSGRWSKYLPGERELCAQLHVSRITLRSALHHLQRQHLIRSAQGKRREIVIGNQPILTPKSDRVVLLAPRPVQLSATFWINKLREDLADAGYHLEFHSGQSFSGQGSARSLKNLIEHLRPAGVVLVLSTEQMQRWFSERGLPCVIIGSRHHGVELPSVDAAYRAACRHAVGQFLTKGHRRLVLLMPESDAAGDLESEEGFNEAIALGKRTDVEGSVVRHDGTIGNICKKVDDLLHRRNPPTGLLVARPGHVLTVMTHLMNSGLRLPRNISVISRDHDSFLENLLPSVARYVVNPRTMAQRISKKVLEIVQGGKIGALNSKIVPEFVDGATFGPPPTP